MEPSDELLKAARSAHAHGDVATARSLYLRILELHPRTEEADEAVRYLLSSPRRPAAAEMPADASDAAASAPG